MNSDTWQNLYRHVKAPQLDPAVVGFNVNIDRIIPVTPALPESPLLCQPDLFELRARLLHSMKNCTAEEWFVTDPARYLGFTRVFSGTGSLSIGGQAGIAAVHLSSIGVPDVLCITHSAGPETGKILIKANVRVLALNPETTGPEDEIHLVFEYPPGLVPLAEGAISRNNRFIVSPACDPASAFIPGAIEGKVISAVSRYTRVFLSGYQYFSHDSEFVRAAGQIQHMKTDNPSMRVHVECVSVTDDAVIGGFARRILPVADSIGLNEHELLLLLHHLCPEDSAYDISRHLSAHELVRGALFVCRKSGIRRLHLHTFGYYVLVIKKESASPGDSLNALLFAALTTVRVAQGSTNEISPVGLRALEQIEKAIGPCQSPGIYVAGTHWIIVIPTIIAHNITKSSGLGDILSSTAFVADRF